MRVNPLTSLSPQFATCAVVGSSGSLLLHKRGRLIDQADAVWRVNDAPVRGFEPHVGSKTTFRVWGGVPLPWRREPPWSDSGNEKLILFCQPSWWVGQCWNLVLEKPHPRLSPLLWSRVRKHVRTATNWTSLGRYPTTGAVTLWAAMRMCRSVQIFGFGNGSWDCAGPEHRSVCSKYAQVANGRPLGAHLLRTNCAPPSKKHPNSGYRLVDYVKTQLHDHHQEWAWIGVLLRHGLISTGPCE